MSDLLNSLLDANLDDLADLPEFGVYPDGAHKVSIAFESKEVNKKASIEFKFKLIETLEMADPAATPLTPGAEGSVLFFLDNEFAQGNLKKILKPIAVELGLSNMREVFEASKGMEVVVVTKARANKEKTQMYNGVTKVIV